MTEPGMRASQALLIALAQLNTQGNGVLEIVRVNIWGTKAPSYQQPVQLVLSLATVPLLMVLVAGQTASQLLIQVGKQSEDLFRGECLPLLPFPIVARTGVPPSKGENFSIE